MNEYINNIFDRFVGIDLIYVNYDKTFPSKIALYMYIKAYICLCHVALIPITTSAFIQVIKSITQIVGFNTGF